MKYMGSKRSMLQNGLGGILCEESRNAARIVDLFCGAGSVSWFAATELRKKVLACDLQQYATTLAGAVVNRTKPAKPSSTEEWLSKAVSTMSGLKGWSAARDLDSMKARTTAWHQASQQFCATADIDDSSVICRSYGGHYFSPSQALCFDAMLLALPEGELRELCLAATIIAASNCAAAPGHTAQPFKATNTASKYLRDSWLRDPVHYARNALRRICPLHAKKRGVVFVGDANEVAKTLKSDDCVFIDPPYSAVQYSRFYHVLETIARGSCSQVEGVGRYPPASERPNSSYSKKSTSFAAIRDLLRALAENGCSVVVTFPKSECSNGLSGEGIAHMAREFFHIRRECLRTPLSTLGGNTVNRRARTVSEQLMLVLKRK